MITITSNVIGKGSVGEVVEAFGPAGQRLAFKKGQAPTGLSSIKAHNLAEHGGHVMPIMEKVSGSSVSAEMWAEFASRLDADVARYCVHTDIKPDNVMSLSGKLYLVDVESFVDATSIYPEGVYVSEAFCPAAVVGRPWSLECAYQALYLTILTVYGQNPLEFHRMAMKTQFVSFAHAVKEALAWV